MTAQTWERRELFRTERLAKLFIEVLYQYRADKKYLLHEFVLMPDHFHLIITPEQITIERAVQFIKGGYSHQVRDLSPNLEIWQKGFSDHRIRDAEDFLKHQEYVATNPVRAHLCSSPSEYPYCSAFPGFATDPIPQRLKPAVLLP